MAVVVRLVQRVAPGDWNAYLALERRFAELETAPGRVRGRRLRPLAGADPIDALVWEAEFPTMLEAMAALAGQDANADHAALFAEQARSIASRRVELYEVIDFSNSSAPS